MDFLDAPGCNLDAFIEYFSKFLINKEMLFDQLLDNFSNVCGYIFSKKWLKLNDVSAAFF